jgi:hypothetical protein
MQRTRTPAAEYVHPATLVSRSGQAEPGGGKGKLAMEHLERPALVVSQVVIAPLRQSVLGWMDADWILPADGSSLLAALERALEGLNGENPAVASAGIVAFIRRVEALIDAGALEAGDGRLPLETARALLSVLGG